MLSTTTKNAPACSNTGGLDTEGIAPMSSDKIQPGYCLCGCGEYIGFFDRAFNRDGIAKGDPKRFAVGHRIPETANETAARFWAKVEKDPESGCWNWTRNKDDAGYGRFSVKRIPVRAHRWAYEEIHGPIPDGLVLDHLCRNTSCVNPDHLEPVTDKVNVLRGVGPTAVHAAQTHCVNGHEFTQENTLERTGRAGRVCRECAKETKRRYRLRKKAQDEQ